MPDLMQVFVLFKSGYVLNLRFNSQQELLSLKDDFEGWGSTSPSKHQITTHTVNLWNPGNSTVAKQSITINWETVVAINLTL